MGNIITAIKNLGKKLNGKYPDGNDVSEVIDNAAKDFPTGTTATKEYVNSLMSGALKRSIVTTLPVEDIDTNTIYMVLDETASVGNVYNEYLYIEEAWELIGTTEVQTNHLYRHDIHFNDNFNEFYITLYTANDTPFTFTTLQEYLFNSNNPLRLPTVGYLNDNGTYYNAYVVQGAGVGIVLLEGLYTGKSKSLESGPVTDTVKQIF